MDENNEQEKVQDVVPPEESTAGPASSDAPASTTVGETAEGGSEEAKPEEGSEGEQSSEATA